MYNDAWVAGAGEESRIKVSLLHNATVILVLSDPEPKLLCYHPSVGLLHVTKETDSTCTPPRAGAGSGFVKPREAAAVEKTGDNVAGRAGLPARQVEILMMALAGKTRSEIAEALHLSPNTVKGLLTRTYRHLGVRNMREAGKMLGAVDVGHGSHGNTMSPIGKLGG